MKSTCARAVSSRMSRVARMTNCIKSYQSCQKDLVNPFHTYGLIHLFLSASRRPWIRPRSWQPGNHSHGDVMVCADEVSVKICPAVGVNSY